MNCGDVFSPATMRKRPLYISFGMPKSGSTLAFQLTRTMLELAGVDQSKIGEGIVDAKTKINYVHRLDGPSLKELLVDARKRQGPIAIKTHSRVFPKVESAFKRGAMFGHAVFRDPRDVVLSMLDAARDGRDWGGNQDGTFRTVADTVGRVRSGIEIFKKWAALPHVMPIHYERVAFDTERVANEIATQLGIETDIPRAIEIATGREFTQLNQGKSQRWRTEMDPADARMLEKEFGEYIATWCEDIPSVPKPRKPASGFLAKWFPRRS